MNWGKSIIVVFLIFAVFIVVFVVKMIFTRADGVLSGYYEKGLKHQESIDEQVGANKFEPQIQVLNSSIKLFFAKMSPDSGSILVQWPADISKSRQSKFKYKSGDTVIVSAGNWKGIRNVMVEFYDKGNAYTFRKQIWVE